MKYKIYQIVPWQAQVAGSIVNTVMSYRFHKEFLN